jgi:protein arginine kinase activator
MCEICGDEEGRIKYTKVINGEKVEFYICEKCAKKKGFIEFMNESEGKSRKEKGRKSSPPEKCSFCGTKLVDIEKEGKLGCPHCYVTFKPFLRDILERLHGDAKHIGKEPVIDKKKLYLKREIREIKNALDDAVKKEKYELAASLRDRIKNLSTKMQEDE